MGNIILFSVLLWLSREAISKGRETKLSSAIAFLYREYTPAFFWWELVEMTRRLIFVGVFVTVKQARDLRPATSRHLPPSPAFAPHLRPSQTPF